MIESDKLLARLKLQQDVEAFLYEEADILDRNELDQWLALLTPDIKYASAVPKLLQVKQLAADGNQKAAMLYDDDMGDLQLRAARMRTGLVWVEDPPSKIVRTVSNVRVRMLEEKQIEACSILTVFCCRRDEEEVTLLARRRDVLREAEGGLRLARREAQLEHNAFRTGNLSVFL